MAEGTIKKLFTEKGFGFIKSDSGEIFFHFSNLVGTTMEELQEGQRVTFEVGEGRKGPQAEQVTPA